MLSLYQRLILGFLLLIAIVGGLGMLVRHSFVHLSALDAQQQAMDVALESLSQVQASLAREQVTADQLAIAPTRELYSQLLSQSQSTEQRFQTVSVAFSGVSELAALQPLQGRHKTLSINSKPASTRRKHGSDWQPTFCARKWTKSTRLFQTICNYSSGNARC
jgi:hypothetical protein